MPLPPTPEALTAIRAVLQACVLLATSLFITGSFWGGPAAPQQVTPYTVDVFQEIVLQNAKPLS